MKTDHKDGDQFWTLAGIQPDDVANLTCHTQGSPHVTGNIKPIVYYPEATRDETKSGFDHPYDGNSCNSSSLTCSKVIRIAPQFL